MSIRHPRALQNASNPAKSSGKIARLRDKALRLREKIKQVNIAFLQRRDDRLAWWQRAFRTPLVGFYGWVFSRAASLWAAVMTLLGFSGGTFSTLASRNSAPSRRGRVRMAMCEGLEPRQLMAVLTADQPLDYVITTDTAPAGFSAGDTVTWTGFNGVVGGDDIPGLIVGTNAFGTIQDAINASLPGDTIKAGPGTYSENLNITTSLTIQGAQSGVDARTRVAALESIIQGPNSNNPAVNIATASGVILDGFTVTSAGALNNTSGVATQASSSNFTIANNIITGSSIGYYANSSSGGLFEKNLVTSNLQTGAAGGTGIYAEKTNGLVVQDNIVKDQTGPTANNPVLFAAVNNGDHVNLTVQRNSLFNNDFGALFIALNGAVIKSNTISTVGPTFATALTLADGSTNVAVESNVLDNNLRGLRIQDFGFGVLPAGPLPISNVTASFNSLANQANPAEGLFVAPGAYSGILNASGNYWGTTDPAVAATKFTVPVAVTVDFSPILKFADSNASLPGYQEVAATATRIVHALGANSEGVNPIQNGYALSLAAPDVTTLEIRNGTYTGNVNLSAATNKNVALAAGSSPGQVAIVGNLTLNAGDTVPIEIANSTLPGGFDNFLVTGSVALGGATLTVDDTGAVLNLADFPLVLINNDGVDAVSGTFAGLLEGATVTGKAGGKYGVSYVGGSGNDVVLSLPKATVVSVVANDTFVQEDLSTKIYPNNGQFEITVTPNPSPTIITYTLTGTANSENVDYVSKVASVAIPAVGTLTIPANATNLVVDINVIDDLLYDGNVNETVVLTIAGASSGGAATLGIVDNEAAPTVSIKATTPNAAEPSTNGAFTVTMTGASDTATTVPLIYTSPGNTAGIADKGTDYNAPASVVIAAGATASVATVTVIDDTLVEGSETVTATLGTIAGNPGIVASGSNSGVVTIADTTDLATVSIGPLSPANASEPSTNSGFVITQTLPSSINTVVSFAVAGTAGGDVDYHFGNVVEVENNNSLFGPQSGNSGPQGLIGFSKNAVTNIDSSTTRAHVSIAGTGDGTVDTYAFYVGAAGTATFDIDGSVGFNSFLELFNAAGTSLGTNNDILALDAGSLTLQDSFLSVALPAAGVYYIRVSEGASSSTDGPDGGENYTLHVSADNATGFGVIAAGSTSIALPVIVIDDLILEPSETVIVTLGGTTVSSDPQVTMSAVVGALTKTITIDDNDTATIQVSSTNAFEPATDGLFTFKFPTGFTSSVDTVFTVVIDNGASTTKSSVNENLANGDLRDHKLAQTTTLTILANQSSVTLSVPVLDSALIEEDETLQVTLTKTAGDAQVSIPATASMLFGDEDAAVVDVDATFAPAVEGGAIGKFTFFLSEAPLGYPFAPLMKSDRDVVIKYTIGGSATNGSDYAPLSGTATIPAFSSTVTILVDATGAFDDLILEGPETVSVTIDSLLTPTDANITIGKGSPSDILTINDNDALTVKVAATQNAVENGALGKFEFSTSGTGTTGVPTVVTYQVKVGSSTAVQGADFTFAPLLQTVTIPAGVAPQSISIDVVAPDDLLLEGTETVTVEILTVSGGPGVTEDPVAGEATGLIFDASTGQVTVTATTNAAEGGDNGLFTVSLGGASPLPTVVRLEVLPASTATSGVDYKLIGGPFKTITFNPFQTQLTIPVEVLDDGIGAPLDQNETVVLEVDSVLSGAYTPNPALATVTILSDQLVSITASKPNAAEASNNGEFVLSLSTPGFGPTTSSLPTVVTFTVAAGAGQATNGSDYTAIALSATIAAGKTTVAIPVSVINDLTLEGSETVTLTLTGISSGNGDITVNGAANSATVTISDDDAAYVSVKATDPNGADNPASDDDGAFTVFISQPSDTATVVSFTISGTADPAQLPTGDYTSIPLSVTIPANSTSVVIPVDVLNDAIVEGTETVTLNLTGPVASPYAAKIFLGALGSTYLSPGVAELKFQDGLAGFTGTYAGTDDTYLDQASQFNLLANFGSDPDIQVSQDTGLLDARHGLLKFNLSQIPANTPISGANLALWGLFPGGISLNPMLLNWTEANNWGTSFSNNGIQANDFEASSTGVAFGIGLGLNTLTNPAVITNVVQGWINGGVNNGWVMLPTGGFTNIRSSENGVTTERPRLTVNLDLTATVNITDTDTAQVNVTGSTPASEPATPGSIIVSMANPSSSPVTVFYTDNLNGTAISGSDYAALPVGPLAFVVIPAGQTSTTITISPLNDSLLEAPETVNITLLSVVTADPDVTLGPQVNGSTMINDNDFAFVTVSGSSNGDENGVPTPLLGAPIDGSFTISLSTPSSVDTVVSLAIGGSATSGADYTAIPLSVTIPANFLSTTIPVAVIDDLINEAPIETVTLTLTGVTSGLLTQTFLGAPSSGTVNIADDEQPLTVTNVATKAIATEGGPNGEFQFQLNYPSDNPTVLTYKLNFPGGSATAAVNGSVPDFDASALPGSVGPSFTTGTITIPTGQTIAVLPVIAFQDYVPDNGETVNLQITSITNNNPNSIVGGGTSTVTINDVIYTVTVDKTDSPGAEPGPPGGSNGQFTFSLTAPLPEPTVVTYSVAGTALPTIDPLTGVADYKALSGTVTIPANTTQFKLSVEVIDDLLVESTETVILTLLGASSAGPSYVFGAPTVGFVNGANQTVSIVDNDVATLSIASTNGAEPGGGVNNIQVTVTQTKASSVPTVVGFTTSGTATRLLDIGGGTIATVGTDVPLAEVEANNTIATAQNIDGGGWNLVSNANINDASFNNTSTAIPHLTINGTGNNTFDYYKFTAGAGQIGIFDIDNPTNFDTELFLYDTAGNLLASNDDLFVDPGSVSTLNSFLQFTFPAAGTYVLGVGRFSSFDLGGGLGIGGATPQPGDVYTLNVSIGYAVTIPAGSTSASVTIPVLNDGLIEGTETVISKLTSIITSDPQVTIGSPSQATGNISDDDTAVVSIVATGPVGFEPGTNDGQYSVVLSAPSAVATVVTYSLVAPGPTDATPGSDFSLRDGALNPIGLLSGSVTIPAGQTSTPIVVDVLDDNIIENAEAVNIKLTGTDNPSKITVNAIPALVTILDSGSVDQDLGKVTITKLVDGSESPTGVGKTDGQFLLTLVPTNPLFNALNGTFSSDENTVVTYQITGGSATNPSDHTLVNGSVTILAGQTTAILTVPVVDDNVAEAPETLIVTLTGVVAPTHTPAIVADLLNPATMSMLDDDVSVLTITNATVLEGASGTTSVTFTVTSPNDVFGGFNVAFSVSGGNATNGVDYTVVTASPLVFVGTAGEQQTITINYNGDNVVELSETFNVTLGATNVSAALVTTGAVGVGTITNDDTATITISSPTVVEGGTNLIPVPNPGTNFNSTMQFVVSTSNPIDIDYTIDVLLANGTALGIDFDPTLAVTPFSIPVNVLTGFDFDNDAANSVSNISRVTFSKAPNAFGPQTVPAGIPITVRVIQDNFVEGGVGVPTGPNDPGVETINASLAAVTTGRSTDTTATGLGTIIDDDFATVSIVANDNQASEPLDTVNLGNGQFTVTQTARSSSDTVITYSVAVSAASATPSGTSALEDDYTALSGTVTILAGNLTATIDVTVLNNTLIEDDETVVVTLTGFVSRDPNVSLGGNLTDTVTIFDDDQATVSISANDKNASEDPLDPGQFTLTLSDVSDTATVVTYSIAAGVGQATNGTDYSALSGTATIAAGQTTTTIDVTVLQDSEIEGAETVTLTLTGFLSPTNADIKVGTATDTVTIADDSDGILVSVVPNGNATEGGGNGSFIVKITKSDGVTPVPAPITGLTVNYSSAGGTAVGGLSGDYVALSGSIFIAPGATTGFIDVSVIDDNIIEPTETVMVTLVNLSLATFPTLVAPFTEPVSIGGASATVNIIDNDVAVFTIDDLIVNEGDGTGKLKIQLNKPFATATVPVTVNYTPINAANPGDFSPLGSQTVSFAPGDVTPKYVTFTIVDDLLVEGLEGFGVTLTTSFVTGPGLEQLNLNDDAVVAISDNDAATLVVRGVKVGSTAWAPTFRDFIDNTGAPDPLRGYAIPTSGLSQTTPLPWTNINQIFVQFSVDPDLATLIPANFVLHGVQAVQIPAGVTPSVVGPIGYDPVTKLATLNLSGNIINDRLRLEVKDAVTAAGNPLDGEWSAGTSNFATGNSGNGIPGGSFNFNFNVLPGDVNQSSAVTVSDVSSANSTIGGFTDGTVAFPAPNTQPYTVFKDVNGTGNVTVSDVIAIFSRTSLPLNVLPPLGSPGGMLAGGGMMLGGGSGPVTGTGTGSETGSETELGRPAAGTLGGSTGLNSGVENTDSVLAQFQGWQTKGAGDMSFDDAVNTIAADDNSGEETGLTEDLVDSLVNELF